MKKIRFWCDSETTGFSETEDQIIEFAVVVDDSEGNVLEEKVWKVKLKDGVIPNPGALLVNKINPFSKKFNKGAVTESQFCREFELLSQKYSEGENKPTFIAYNAEFDKRRLAIALNRNGKKLSNLISPSVVDPMKTAKQLTESGKISTPLSEKSKKPSYKLEHVVHALGDSYNGNAHSALADTHALRNVSPKLFKLATGYQQNETFAVPGAYQPGQVVNVITDSKSSGVKTRHIKVIQNDMENGKIVALDEDDIKKNGGFKESSVRTFNYDTIVGELPKSPDSENSLSALYSSKKEQIDTLAATAKGGSRGSALFDEETRNFGLIEATQKRMSSAKDKKAEYEAAYSELIEKLNGDKVSAKTILTKAERLAQSMGLKGWSKEIVGPNDIGARKFESGDDKVIVVLHPSGIFKTRVEYGPKDENGEQMWEKADIKNTRDLMSFLKDKITDKTLLNKFISELPKKEAFLDEKHPVVLLSSVNEALDKLRVNPGDEEAKAAVNGVLLMLKKEAPSLYEKYKTFDDPDFQDKYWEPEDSGANTPEPFIEEDGQLSMFKPEQSETPNSVANIHEAKQKIEENENKNREPVQLTFDDHRPEGTKESKVPCSLCNRPLSQALSKELAMGPTCRIRAAIIDSSKGSIEEFADRMEPLGSSTQSLRQGEASIVRIKNYKNEEKSIFANVIEKEKDGHVKLLDRRKFQSFVDSGKDTVLSYYMATMRVKVADVVAVGKVAPKKIPKVA